MSHWYNGRGVAVCPAESKCNFNSSRVQYVWSPISTWTTYKSNTYTAMKSFRSARPKGSTIIQSRVQYEWSTISSWTTYESSTSTATNSVSLCTQQFKLWRSSLTEYNSSRAQYEWSSISSWTPYKSSADTADNMSGHNTVWFPGRFKECKTKRQHNHSSIICSSPSVDK